MKGDKRETQATVCAVIVHRNKALLVLHAKLNKWLFPGGHIDENETPDQAVIREIKEETGLDLRLSDYGPVKDSPDIMARLAVPFHVNIHSVGDHNHYCLLYMGSVKSPKTRISKESKALRWFGKDELDSVGAMPENIKNIAIYALSKRR